MLSELEGVVAERTKKKCDYFSREVKEITDARMGKPVWAYAQVDIYLAYFEMLTETSRSERVH